MRKQIEIEIEMDDFLFYYFLGEDRTENNIISKIPKEKLDSMIPGWVTTNLVSVPEEEIKAVLEELIDKHYSNVKFTICLSC